MESYSVTTCLGAYFNAAVIPPDVLERACRNGTVVHQYCNNYINNIPTFNVEDELSGYFQSFREWFDSYVEEVYFSERRLYDESYCYHGQPDLGARLVDGRSLIIDMKTPVSVAPTWALQNAGYLHLARINFLDIKWDGCMSLRLRPDGSAAKATVYADDARDFAVFLSALNVHRYLQ